MSYSIHSYYNIVLSSAARKTLDLTSRIFYWLLQHTCVDRSTNTCTTYKYASFRPARRNRMYKNSRFLCISVIGYYIIFSSHKRPYVRRPPTFPHGNYIQYTHVGAGSKPKINGYWKNGPNNSILEVRLFHRLVRICAAQSLMYLDDFVFKHLIKKKR